MGHYSDLDEIHFDPAAFKKISTILLFFIILLFINLSKYSVAILTSISICNFLYFSYLIINRNYT